VPRQIQQWAAHGSSAPNYLGKFNDKTALEVDRSGACNGDVYFAYSRFTGNAQTNAIYFSRSTDHGATFSPPMKITAAVHGVQDPSIAVTGNGHVYVTFRQFASQSGQPDAIDYTKSTDCGQSFTMAQQLQTFTPYDAQDVLGPFTAPSAPPSSEDPLFDAGTASAGSSARDCGDFSSACKSGYTFFRHTTAARSTADQFDRSRELVYIVYDPTKPDTEVATGSTYGSIQSGTESQEAVYFMVLNGATGTHTTPRLLDPQVTGHQLFPAISADGGTLHVLWWDSRLDPCYSPQRPIGNCADRSTVPSLDVYATQSPAPGNAFSTPVRVTDVTSNPNYEQFAGRTVPFAGDYLYINSMGTFSYGVWTDWRNTVPGTDQREANYRESSNENADVLQCRALNSSTGTYGSDRRPRLGGLDQNIYGDYTP